MGGAVVLSALASLGHRPAQPAGSGGAAAARRLLALIRDKDALVDISGSGVMVSVPQGLLPAFASVPGTRALVVATDTSSGEQARG